MMNAVSKSLNLFLVSVLLFLSSCSEDAKNEPLNNLSIQNLVKERFHGLDELQVAASSFYSAVFEEDWSLVYHFLSQEKTRFVDEKTFVTTLKQKMSNFSLVELEFLMIEVVRSPSGEVIKCRVVVRVVQNPHLREHTSVVNWFKESSDWKCDSTGLRGTPLL